MTKKKKKDKTTKNIYRTLPRTLDLEHHKHNLKSRWTQVIPAPLVIHVMLQLNLEQHKHN